MKWLTNFDAKKLETVTFRLSVHKKLFYNAQNKLLNTLNFLFVSFFIVVFFIFTYSVHEHAHVCVHVQIHPPGHVLLHVNV
jgi:hypothetical protein